MTYRSLVRRLARSRCGIKSSRIKTISGSQHVIIYIHSFIIYLFIYLLIFFSANKIVTKGISPSLFEETIKLQTWTRNQNSHLHNLIIYQYTDWSNATDPYVLLQRYMDVNTDANFKAPAILSADAFIKKQAPTYFYQLEKSPKWFPGYPPPPAWAGIYHGADVFYLFSGPFLVDKNLTSDTDKKISKDIMTLWTNFAKTG